MSEQGTELVEDFKKNCLAAVLRTKIEMLLVLVPQEEGLRKWILTVVEPEGSRSSWSETKKNRLHRFDDVKERYTVPRIKISCKFTYERLHNIKLPSSMF